MYHRHFLLSFPNLLGRRVALELRAPRDPFEGAFSPEPACFHQAFLSAYLGFSLRLFPSFVWSKARGKRSAVSTLRTGQGYPNDQKATRLVHDPLERLRASFALGVVQ